MNPLEEMIKTLMDIEYKAQNTFELYNINVIVPDDYVDENGNRKYRTINNIQIKFSDYLQTKTNELKKYLKIHVSNVVSEDKRIQAYLTRQYRTNEKRMKRLLLK